MSERFVYFYRILWQIVFLFHYLLSDPEDSKSDPRGQFHGQLVGVNFSTCLTV